MTLPTNQKPRHAYMAPQNLGFREHIDDWAKNSERRFEARMLDDKARVQAGGADAEIVIFDVIGVDWMEGSVTSKDVEEALREVDSANTIRVLLNSPGGYLHEGVAIFNLLKRHPAKVIVEVIGEAASAASLVLMAGDQRIMRPGSAVMVHPAWGCQCGGADDMLAYAEYLNTGTDRAIEVIAERSGRDAKEVAKIVRASKLGTWFSADQAIEQGLADELVTGSEEPAPKAGDDDDERTVDVNINIASNDAGAIARFLREGISEEARVAPTRANLAGIQWALNSSRPRA